MLKVTLALATAAAAIASAPAAAENLTVNGTVAPYCSIRLANVSSGTATIAFESEQKIANLQVACNQGTGTKLIVDPANGDLVNGNVARINYAMRLESPDNALDINTTDTAPGNVEGQGVFTRNRAGYSQAIANGLGLELFMNVNVANSADAPDFNGPPQFPANAAPAGTYVENFTFTVSSI